MTAGSRAQVADDADREEWDALVARAEESSWCHLWDWGRIIEDVFGHQALFRVARRSDSKELLGILPLFELRSVVFGRHLVSVPFMNYGGPCGSPEARELLASWAIEEGQRRNAHSVLLRTRVAVPGSFQVSSSKVTAVLPLEPSVDRMWKDAFDAKFRNKIKRPQREGMTTRFGTENFDAFYEVFAHNMRDLGTPVLPRSFFQRILAAFRVHVVLGVTYQNDQPVAAGFGFIWRDEYEMTWSSSLKQFRTSKPNMLLYWDYMRELITRGVRRFNFARSTPGSGPHEFKRSWGATDEPLPWIHWPRLSTGSGESAAANAASAVWRHLPLRITNTIGPVLARQLPWW